MNCLRKTLSLVLTVLLVLPFLSCFPAAVNAESDIDVGSDTISWQQGNTYHVRQEITIEERITVNGTVKLYIESGAKLIAESGIKVAAGSKLYIEGNGVLDATGVYGNAGIGADLDKKAGSIIINSEAGSNVDVTAVGGTDAAGIGAASGEDSTCEEIIISGGTVTVYGNRKASGLGAGYKNDVYPKITISNATVTARGGGTGGAGIAGPVTITDSIVYAHGFSGGAGIGSPYQKHMDWPISISGNSTVKAYSYNNGGAGIGAGRSGSVRSNGKITISGGYVEAKGSGGGAGIGGGYSGDMEAELTISGGTVKAYGSAHGAGIGGGYFGNAGKATINISGGTVEAYGYNEAAAIGGGEEGSFWSGYAGGEGATVNITGGKVVAYSDHTAIGHGGSDSMGTLYIADNMSVMAGDTLKDSLPDEGLFPEQTRVVACQYRHNAVVEVCRHDPSGVSYTYDSSKHTMTCKYCKSVISEEHSLEDIPGTAIAGTCIIKGKEADQRCGICGYSFVTPYTAYGDHNWNETTYVWTNNNQTCTAYHTCLYSSDHSEYETVTAAATVSKKANCSNKGETTYTAVFVNAGFNTETKTVEDIDIDPDAHSWSDWTTDTNASCTETGTEKRVCTNGSEHFETRPIAALGHIWSDWKVSKEASETQEGEETRICARDSSHIEKRSIPVTDHTHILSRVDAKEPECTQAGNIAYYVCDQGASPCHKYYEDDKAEKEITQADTIIPATGHSWIFDGFEWNESGSGAYTVTANFRCSIDNVKQETVHEPVRRTIAATCQEKESITYSITIAGSSSLDGNKHSDSITVDGEQALGHSWSEAYYSWEKDYSNVTAVRFCTRDTSHIESETVNTASSISKDPTCTDKGTTTYTAVFSNEAFSVEPKTVENIDPLGHDWQPTSYKWQEVEGNPHNAMYATFICNRDTTHLVEETTKNITSVVSKYPTCTDKGETTYTAHFVTPGLLDQSDTVEDIDALGHDWADPVYTWSQFNTSASALRICRHDLTHTERQDASSVTSSIIKEATYDEDGIMEYTAHFTDPFVPQTKQVIIPKTSDKWADPVYEWSEDYSGLKATRENLSRPEYSVREMVNTTFEIIKKPTVSEEGEIRYTSDKFIYPYFEIQSITVKIPPLKSCTITYDLNGGTLNGQNGIISFAYAENELIYLPLPYRQGYIFDYWEGSIYNAGDEYLIKDDHTFKAVWKKDDDKKQEENRNSNVLPYTGEINDTGRWLKISVVSGILALQAGLYLILMDDRKGR